jgi:hypothetical protein
VRRRFAVFARIFACCVLLSAPVFPQEPAPNPQPGNGSQNTGQKNPEQRPLPEPKVFFPNWPSSPKWRCTITARFLK